MDVSSLDGFLCAVLSGPNVIMPSKWIPWVWDSTVEAYQDADARHQGFVELIAPAARNIHAYWLARRAPAPDTIGDTRRPIHKVPVPGRNDRCPCGSGKKFKHCHGAPKLLH